MAGAPGAAFIATALLATATASADEPWDEEVGHWFVSPFIGYSFLDSDLFEYQPFSADYVPQNPCGDGISSPAYGSPIGYCSLTGVPAYATAR